MLSNMEGVIESGLSMVNYNIYLFILVFIVPVCMTVIVATEILCWVLVGKFYKGRKHHEDVK